jgi:hypothetical protein
LSRPKFVSIWSRMSLASPGQSSSIILDAHAFLFLRTEWTFLSTPLLDLVWRRIVEMKQSRPWTQISPFVHISE